MSLSSAFSKVSGGLRGFLREFFNSITAMRVSPLPARAHANPKGYGKELLKVLFSPRQH